MNPKNLPNYIEIEENSYPKEVLLRKKTKTVTTEDGDVEVNNEEVDYTLSLKESSYPYRLWWQYIAGLDSINDENFFESWITKSFMDKVEDELSPVYDWGYDEYTKDITNSTQYWEERYKDGRLVSRKLIRQVDKTEYYPLPLLDNVSTSLADYSFVISEDIETLNTGWSERQNEVTHTWTTGGDPIYDELTGEEIGRTPTHHHKKTGYIKTKRIVVEDYLQETVETINKTRLDAFMIDNDIQQEDLGLIVAMWSGEYGEVPPETEDFMESFSQAFEKYKFNQMIVEMGGSLDIEVVPSEYTNDIPLFLQYDSRWGDYLYTSTGNPKQTIAYGGCGTTSFSMIATGLNKISDSMDTNNDSVIDPLESSNWSVNHGYRTVNSGTAWGFFARAGETSGLRVTQYGKSEYKEVLNKLEQGIPVIVSMSRGHFTESGHFIVLVGIDENGKIIVNDPNKLSENGYRNRWTRTGVGITQSKLNDFTNKKSKPEIVITEAKQYWTFED